MEVAPLEPIGYSRKRASEILDRSGIDVLVASTDANVFYTTGLPVIHVTDNPILWVLKNQFPYISLVRRDGELSLFYWMAYSSADKFSWVKDTTGIVSPQQALQGMADKITEWQGSKKKTIGLESLMPRYQSEFLRSKFPEATFVEADDVFLQMRVVKSEEEIRRIKRSTQVAESAINAVIEAAHEKVTDNELLEMARRKIVECGAPGWDHLTMGIGSSDPEAPGIGTTMMKGDLSRIDVGAVWQGYVSDLSREFVVGTIPDGAQETIDRLIKVQDFCVENIKPGAKPGDVLKAAMEYHKTLKKALRPIITCHSLGLECEEVQMFSPMRTAPIPFQQNMTVDIEVWQPFQQYRLVGIEDAYRITSSGCERLSTLDRHIAVR
jgi:Xaa-Pro aminopeptidase